ncbi:hypothetical protein Fmac_013536 [Flemingia macrophylla]|uniref:Uncharacterized protein n=1 Tax=Flemingia macrophylla TaxID=520843 RepID=A0ABD1MTE5_9FABA
MKHARIEKSRLLRKKLKFDTLKFYNPLRLLQQAHLGMLIIPPLFIRMVIKSLFRVNLNLSALYHLGDLLDEDLFTLRFNFV